jgi:hypothetical protein
LPDAWLPILTDVVQRGSPPDAADHEPLEAAAMVAREVAATEDLAPPPAGQSLETSTAVEVLPEPVGVSETARQQEPVVQPEADEQDAWGTASLVEELAPKITGLMQEQVAEELRRSLDQSMANLMANLNANVEEIVRQAVEEKLAGKDKKSS